MKNMKVHAGLLAALFGVAAVLGFGAALPGYSQMVHPVSLLGATGVPHALAFSLLGFVIPGLLAAVVAVALLQRLPATASWTLRVGGQMMVLAAMAFAAMGLLPLDGSDIESRASQFHASAWMLWVVAFVPGALMLAVGGWKQPPWRSVAVLSLAAALAVAVAAFVLDVLMPVALAQRLAFASWLLWLALVARTGPGTRTRH
ncbi:DUF998 domain-containing protein [Stenotrophomonas sp. YIM B06876]|uniref:DUF998 domain-containing protein n=1 Tax=Stenotrophomonas sp. YIM B06876 TaxID=3060211 RepID=UPI0027384E6F|nr:DUF998 domain-containing protein [Stenotrophomonas sp. YIM B06876]